MKEQNINVDELTGIIQEAFECIMPIKEIARGLVNDQFKNSDMLQACTFWLIGYMRFKLEDNKVEVFKKSLVLRKTKVVIIKSLLTIEIMVKNGLDTDIIEKLKQWVGKYGDKEIWE